MMTPNSETFITSDEKCPTQPENERSDQNAGQQIAQDRSEPQAMRDGNGDDRRRQIGDHLHGDGLGVHALDNHQA